MRLVLSALIVCVCVVVASCRDERHMMRIMRLWCESIGMTRSQMMTVMQKLVVVNLWPCIHQVGWAWHQDKHRISYLTYRLQGILGRISSTELGPTFTTALSDYVSSWEVGVEGSRRPSAGSKLGRVLCCLGLISRDRLVFYTMVDIRSLVVGSSSQELGRKSAGIAAKVTKAPVRESFL